MTRRLFWRGISLIALVLSLGSIYAQFGGGTGTAVDPWVINRAQHLDEIRDNYLSGHFIQTTDIDLEEYLWDERENNYINDGEGWMPIGTSAAQFTGHYDGDGHVIDNLYINRPGVSYQGLFGYLGPGSIRNLGVINGDVTGSLNNAILAGYNNGTITSCYTTGELLSGSQGGGISGNSRTVVDCCWSSCNVTGQNERVINLGSLLGYNYGSVSNSYCTGTVRLGRESIGGLIGRTWRGTVTNCYSRSRVIGTDVAGGLIGHNREATITNCYSTGSVQAGTPGGLIGDNENEAEDGVALCYWDREASQVQESQGGEGRMTRQMTLPYDLATTYVRWDFEEIWKDDPRGFANDGYPVLFYQEVEPPIILDVPVVKIEIITIDEEDKVKLSWEAIDEANSYLIFSSIDPYTNDWEQPVAIVGETSYIEEVSEPKKRFYYVVASTDEPPGD